MDELFGDTLGVVVGYLHSLDLLGGTLATVGALAILSRVHGMSHVLVRKVSYSLKTSKHKDGSKRTTLRVIGSRLLVLVNIYYKKRSRNENVSKKNEDMRLHELHHDSEDDLQPKRGRKES